MSAPSSLIASSRALVSPASTASPNSSTYPATPLLPPAISPRLTSRPCTPSNRLPGSSSPFNPHLSTAFVSPTSDEVYAARRRRRTESHQSSRTVERVYSYPDAPPGLAPSTVKRRSRLASEGLTLESISAVLSASVAPPTYRAADPSRQGRKGAGFGPQTLTLNVPEIHSAAPLGSASSVPDLRGSSEAMETPASDSIGPSSSSPLASPVFKRRNRALTIATTSHATEPSNSLRHGRTALGQDLLSPLPATFPVPGAPQLGAVSPTHSSFASGLSTSHGLENSAPSIPRHDSAEFAKQTSLSDIGRHSVTKTRTEENDVDAATQTPTQRPLHSYSAAQRLPARATPSSIDYSVGSFTNDDVFDPSLAAGECRRQEQRSSLAASDTSKSSFGAEKLCRDDAGSVRRDPRTDDGNATDYLCSSWHATPMASPASRPSNVLVRSFSSASTFAAEKDNSESSALRGSSMTSVKGSSKLAQGASTSPMVTKEPCDSLTVSTMPRRMTVGAPRYDHRIAPPVISHAKACESPLRSSRVFQENALAYHMPETISSTRTRSSTVAVHQSSSTTSASSQYSLAAKAASDGPLLDATQIASHLELDAMQIASHLERDRMSPSNASQKVDNAACELCGALTKNLAVLQPCGHQACATCCSSGVNQVATTPPRRHVCSACQRPVEGFSLPARTGGPSSLSPVSLTTMEAHAQEKQDDVLPRSSGRASPGVESQTSAGVELQISSFGSQNSCNGHVQDARPRPHVMQSCDTSPSAHHLPAALSGSTPYWPRQRSTSASVASEGAGVGAETAADPAEKKGATALGWSPPSPWSQSRSPTASDLFDRSPEADAVFLPEHSDTPTASGAGDSILSRGPSKSMGELNAAGRFWPRAIVRVDNIPWTVVFSDVLNWIPEREAILAAVEDNPQPVHIPLDLNNGKTNNSCFIECRDASAAKKLIRHRNNTRLCGRPVSLILSSVDELLNELFTTRKLSRSLKDHEAVWFTSHQLNNLAGLLKTGAAQLKSPLKPVEFATSMIHCVPPSLSIDQRDMLFDRADDIVTWCLPTMGEIRGLRQALDRLLAACTRCEAFTISQKLRILDHARENLRSLRYNSDSLDALLTKSHSECLHVSPDGFLPFRQIAYAPSPPFSDGTPPAHVFKETQSRPAQTGANSLGTPPPQFSQEPIHQSLSPGNNIPSGLVGFYDEHLSPHINTFPNQYSQRHFQQQHPQTWQQVPASPQHVSPSQLHGLGLARTGFQDPLGKPLVASHPGGPANAFPFTPLARATEVGWQRDGSPALGYSPIMGFNPMGWQHSPTASAAPFPDPNTSMQHHPYFAGFNAPTNAPQQTSPDEFNRLVAAVAGALSRNRLQN